MQKPIIDTYPESAELTTAAPKLKPARSRAWSSVGIVAFIGLLILGAGAWGLSSFLPSFSKPTELSDPANTDPVAALQFLLQVIYRPRRYGANQCGFL